MGLFWRVIILFVIPVALFAAEGETSTDQAGLLERIERLEEKLATAEAKRSDDCYLRHRWRGIRRNRCPMDSYVSEVRSLDGGDIEVVCYEIELVCR